MCVSAILVELTPASMFGATAFKKAKERYGGFDSLILDSFYETCYI